VSYGLICDRCTKQCKEDLRSIEIECIHCKGEGCDACEKQGHFNPPECPKKYVGGDLLQAIDVAWMARDYGLPVAGGTIDQSAWFMDMLINFRSECNRIEVERQKK
jgi:hypothetical protein